MCTLRQSSLLKPLRYGLTFALIVPAFALCSCADGSFKNPSDWNRKERGAAIGGTSGAALGAIVGSQTGHTGGGALLGGAAGAGAGALIGNELDKDRH